MKMPRPLNVRQLEAFRAVMLAGSMTAAGRFLSISQPAVTRLVRELELELKLELFLRDGTHIIPTEEARALFKEVERHYAGTERIREAAYAIREFRGTRFKIAANLSLSLRCLPKAVAKFETIFPKSVLTINSGLSSEVINLVSGGSADIGFAAIRPGRRDVVTEPLATSQWFCIMPAGHPLEDRNEVLAKDLDGIDFISVGPSSMARFELDATLQSAGASPHVRLETQYSVQAAGFVREGLGVAVVDPLVASSSKESGLVIKKFSPNIPYVISVIYPLSAKPGGLLTDFVSMVKAVYEDTIKELV